MFSDHGIAFLALENGQITKIDKNYKKTEKNEDFIKKKAKIRDITMLTTNPMLLETIQRPIIKP